jgi:hypothetical protein
MRLNKQRLQMCIVACIAVLAVSIASFNGATAHAASRDKHADGSGHVYGQLLNGTKRNAAVAGQTVTLQEAQGDNSQDAASVKTDARGFYSFDRLATDKTLNYAIYINYQGAQYTSDIVTLDSKAEQRVNLTIYDATSDSSKVAIIQATILMQAPDVNKKTFTVSEYYNFKNLDTHAFVGSLDSSQGKPKALFFSLPQGARSINLTGGFNGYRSIQVDRGFASNAALPPGDSEFAFSFEVPYSAATYDFRYVAMYPTVQLSFMLPPAVHATSGVLVSQGIVTADQHPYQLFKTTELRTNQEVHMGIEGLSASTPGNSTSPLNSGVAWLIVALVLMLVVIVITWFIYRSRRLKPSIQASGQQKISARSASKGTAKDVTAIRGVKDLDRQDRQQELLQELLDLDRAYEAKKMTKAVYQERRAKTKARLRSLMGEQEAARK